MYSKKEVMSQVALASPEEETVVEQLVELNKR